MKELIEKREKFVNDWFNRIVKNMTDNDLLTMSVTTCSAAPSFGWSKEEFMFMPKVASKLRENGFTVHSEVNFEVTDWTIAI